MKTLSVRLFGKLDVYYGNDCVTDCFTSFKALELFCYLLLHRNRPHTRESIAALLWNDVSTSLARKYLRKVIWQLQQILGGADVRIIIVESEWIYLNREAQLWLDVITVEQAFVNTYELPGHALDEQAARSLQAAVQLYRGALLEGWYQDWCLYEREKWQNMYFMMLDKLIVYCTKHDEYDSGISYGMQLLHFDQTNELAHRRLMRLHHLRGDRTTAMHQYQSCVAALQRELDMKPMKETVDLYEQICTDRLGDIVDRSIGTAPGVQIGPAKLQDLLQWLKQVQAHLSRIQTEVQQKIQLVEQTLEE
ncbi:MAG: hypothetical protein MI924_00165 [Chloroflexales bacterium]|nr:hypothetical protein [Chloroflexales bacterium]